jgi:hypothetical protein
MATNKDKALQIVNKLFEICEQDFEVRFTGHCGEMAIDFRRGNHEGWHSHIFDHVNFSEQLQLIIQALHKAEDLQKEYNEK